MKKGFTLVELLAVIVILAVIALIAIPVTTKIISETKVSSLKASISNYNNALEREIELSKISDEVTTDGKYTIIGKSYTKDGKTKNIEIKGTLPKSGNVCISKKGVITQYSYAINGYVISKLTGTEQTIKKGEKLLNVICSVKDETVEIIVANKSWASSKEVVFKANTTTSTLQYKIVFESDPSKNVDWTNIENNSSITLEGIATEEKPIHIYAKLTDGVNSSAEAYYKETKLYSKEKGFASVAKVGDYVKMVPTATSYSVPSSYTGCTGYRANSLGWPLDCNPNQTINPSELDIWRVIDINEDGTLELISHYVSTDMVNFHAKVGYNNLVGALNVVAQQYKNEKYTIGYRHIGYHGQTEFLSSYCSSTTACSEPLGGGDTYYTYDTDPTNGIVYKALGTLVATTKEGTAVEYWLASRYYAYTSCYSNWYNRYIGTDGNVTVEDAAKTKTSCTTEFARAHAIRPIVKLKAGIEISGGDGTNIKNAWILN